MPFTLNEALDGVRGSRAFFLKHLRDLRADQWDWKPYPECKSIRETLAHLIVDDSAALQSLETGGEPDYEGLQVTEQDTARLFALLEESHTRLLAYLLDRYADAPLDTVVTLWSSSLPLGRAATYLTSEDYYHAGQVGYIRMATDPTWDYYTAIYGGEA